MFPRVSLFLHSDILFKLLFQIILKKTSQRFSYCVRLRLHYESCFAMGNNFRESANVGHEHGALKMIRYLGDATLGGRAVRLFHYRRGTEVLFHPCFGDVFVSEHH